MRRDYMNAMDVLNEQKRARYIDALTHAAWEADDMDFWGTKKQKREAHETLDALYDECKCEGVEIPTELEKEIVRLQTGGI